MNLLKNVKVTQVLGYFAAGVTARKAEIIDMAGYEGCLFIFQFGTLIEAGTLDCFVNGDAANATGAMSRLLTTTAHTVTAADAAKTQSCVMIDVYQPDPVLHRYLEAVSDPSDQNAVILGITAIQYSGKVHPDVNGASVLKSTLLTSPAE